MQNFGGQTKSIMVFLKWPIEFGINMPFCSFFQKELVSEMPNYREKWCDFMLMMVMKRNVA